MPPFSDEHRSGNSGGAPASSAPPARTEGSGATPGRGTANSGNAHPVAQESREAAASVPAGEPEAPVAPVAQVEDPEPAAPGEAQVEDPEPAPPGETQVEDAEPAAPDETQVEHDLDELAARAQKADEYLELAQRTRADFENYRKRAARETAAAQERGVVKLVRELLPAVDNLDRAVDAISANGESADELVSGIKLVHAEVIAALARAGVERFSPVGEPFDPAHHEAVAQQPVEGAESGTVAEVYQRGYRLGDSVIRPARVLVAG
jgi:molecular chaperone GrpE